LRVRQALKDHFWLPIVLIGVLLIYVPGLGNELVYDDGYLADGSLFQDYRALQLRVRFLSYGSFVWVQAILGDGWWKQRLVNIAIHAAVVWALWGLYREILRHVSAAPNPDDPHAPVPPLSESWALPFAIGFFALNPVAVYAVGYLIQRSILLATFFVVVAFWSLARATTGGKAWLYAVSLAAYAAATLAKEHAVLAPLAAIPLYVVVARPDRKRLALAVGASAAVIAVAASLLWLRYGEVIGKPFDETSQVYLAQLSQLDPNAAKHAYPLSVVNEAYLFFKYGALWLVPYAGWMSINLRPPFPVSWITFPQLLGLFAYAGVVIGGAWLVARFRDWRALVGLSLLMPALLFASEFATVWVQDPYVLYRSYLWAIGIPGIVFFLVHGPSARVLSIVAIVVACLLIWQAQDRIFSMATAERAWSDAIAKLPDDPRSVGRWFPYVNRGAVHAERNEVVLAMRDFDASSRLADGGMGAMNRGSLLSAAGKQAEALAAFDEAERQGYKLYNLPFQRGLALLALRRPTEALSQFQAASSLQPPSPTRELVLLHIGRILLQMQKTDDAISVLEGLMWADPKNKEGKYLLGMAYVTANQPEKARAVLDRLIAEDRNPRAYYARALANYGLKRKAEALADIETAIRTSPTNPNLIEWQRKIQALP